jgi:putative aminopeptidase FrvX
MVIIPKDEMFQIIKDLAEKRAPSGLEQKRSNHFKILIQKMLKEKKFQISTDRLGNVIVRIPPTEKNINVPKICFIGHSDEIGGTIYKIKKNGRLLFQKRGGFEARWLISKKVAILTLEGKWINGVILGRTIHAIPASARIKKNPEVNQLEVYIGVESIEEVEKIGIHIGAPLVIEGYTQYLNSDLNKDIILSNSLDNIVSLTCLLELAARLNDYEFNADIYLVSAVREEIGREGSLYAARNINPDLCVAIDFAVVESEKDAIDCGGKLNGGPMIVWAEAQGKGILDYNLAREFVGIAKKKNLKFQNGVFEFYGSDSGILQKSLGIPSLLIAVPMLCGHNIPEIISISEIYSCVDLIIAWLNEKYLK